MQYPRPLENLLPSKCGVESLQKQLSKYSLGTAGILKTPLSGQCVKSNPFIIILKYCLPFFILLSIFQTLPDIWYHNRMDTEADLRIQLSFVNADIKDFLGGSDGKSICLHRGRPRFYPWVGKIPWRRNWQPAPVLLPGKSHGWRSLVGYSPWGCKESDTTEWLHYTLFSYLFYWWNLGCLQFSVAVNNCICLWVTVLQVTINSGVKLLADWVCPCWTIFKMIVPAHDSQWTLFPLLPIFATPLTLSDFLNLVKLIGV